MFSFFRKNDQPSDTSTSRVGVTPAEMPGIKICPKCNRLYRPKTVVCIFDESLLYEKNPPPKEQQQPISSVTATREDDSKWTLLTNKPLGTGSLCAVYEAIDMKDGKPVVVKILQSHLMNDRKAERRFLEGAKLALPLVHENIIRQLATGAYVDTRHKVARPLTVFEYIEGKQLSNLIDEDNLPTAADTLSIASDVCSALQYAHENGVIHGDLKPSNIFLQEVGDRVIAKVCDFAVAERLFSGLEWERVTTMTCSLYGSATYLAPDYANSRQLSAVADLYSLGCIMYECLVGFPPFHGANDFMTIMQHMNEAPKALAATDTPQVVSDIVMKALAKDPSERWQSAEQMNVAIKIAQKKLGNLQNGRG